MATANERQHGGDHYKGSDYNHWDWVTDVKLGYLAGNASKYAFRWRRKGNPEEDLDKAIHYVDKAAEVAATGSPVGTRMDAFWEFILANNVILGDAPSLYYIMEGRWGKAREALEAMKQGFLKQS